MKTYPLLMLPLIAGCLSSAPQAPDFWTIDFTRSAKVDGSAKRFGESVRIASVDVRAPYAGNRLAVLRPDGSIAFDSFNSFAGSPALLMRGAARDVIESSGMFGSVLASSSSARAQYAIEIAVTQLALDCRTEGRRTAKVAFALVLLNGREVVASVRGAGAEEAGDDYSAAFSTAFARAMQDALGKLPVK